MRLLIVEIERLAIASIAIMTAAAAGTARSLVIADIVFAGKETAEESADAAPAFALSRLATITLE